MAVSAFPIYANIYWIIPEVMWAFAQKYIADQAENLEIEWLRLNLSPYYYIPLLMSVHVFILSAVRLTINLGFLLFSAIKNA